MTENERCYIPNCPNKAQQCDILCKDHRTAGVTIPQKLDIILERLDKIEKKLDAIGGVK